MIQLLLLLALLAPGQIGGYFKLSPIPNSVSEGQKFTVLVTLETTAREEVKLAIEADNLHAPAEVVIPKGQKTASFEVRVGYFQDDVRTAQRPLIGRLVVSSGKSRVGRDLTILRDYRY